MQCILLWGCRKTTRQQEIRQETTMAPHGTLWVYVPKAVRAVRDYWVRCLRRTRHYDKTCRRNRVRRRWGGLVWWKQWWRSRGLVAKTPFNFKAKLEVRRGFSCEQGLTLRVLYLLTVICSSKANVGLFQGIDFVEFLKFCMEWN